MMPKSLIIRSGASFALTEARVSTGGTLDTPEDARAARPLEVLLNAALDLLVDGESGVWILGSVG
jgi:hypothetical protein